MEMVPTPAPVPTPFPMPFVGMIEPDAIGFLVQIGVAKAISWAFDTPPSGPVLINGMPAAKTGDEARNHRTLPHMVIPPGTMWTPLPKPLKLMMRPGPPPPPDSPAAPAGDAILITGSDSVYINGNPACRLGDTAMSCGEPVRLPSSTLLAIPKGLPVIIGGGKKLDYQAAAKAFFLRNKWTAGLLHQLVSLLPPGRLQNLAHLASCFMTGHPVDVATGRMMTFPVDFELPGPIPLKFQRVYASSWCERPSELGYGWSHTLDERIWLERGKVVYKTGDGRELEFDAFHFPGRRMAKGQENWHAVDKLTLRCLGDGKWTIRSKDGLTREFGLLPGNTKISRLLQIRDRVENTIRLEYNRKNELEYVTDSAGRQLRFIHDGHGRLHRIALPAPTWDGWFDAVKFEYSKDEDLVGAKDANGNWTRYEYDRHLMVRETDRDGLSFYFVYDGDDSTAACVRTWGDGGIFDHEIVYDRLHMRTFVTDSLGHTKTYQMNPANAVVAVYDAHGAETRYEYNDVLWKTAEVGPLGATTRFEHDARGNVTRTTIPNGASSTVTYDRFDRPLSATDIAGVEWQWFYDEFGRVLWRKTSAGEVLRVTYEGKVACVMEINLDRYELRHDEQGNVTHVTRPDGAVLIRKFDHLGRMKARRDVAGNLTELERDLLGRVVAVRTPDGTVRQAKHSHEGDLLAVFNGYTWIAYTYEGFHVLASQTVARDTVRWEHDTEGQLVAVTNEIGETYRFLRDARGDVKEEVGFDGRKHVFVRDHARRVTMLFKPSKSHQKFGYDVMGNVTEVLYPDGSKDSFTYSVTGRLLTATNAAGTAWFERDARGRVMREGFGDDWVRSAYDERHRRIGVATSRGLAEHIERDILGDVRAIAAPDAGWQATFERNIFGHEIARTLPGGIHSRWERDNEGRPLAQYIAKDGQWIRSTRYRWSGQERIAEISDSVDGASLFYHDDRSRLIGADYVARGERQRRFLDPAGNIYKQSGASDRRYGKGGVLLEAEGTKYAYDGDGNVTARELPTGERWEYVWNGAGRLAEVCKPDGSKVTFKYDALARRIEKALYKAHAKDPQATVRWVWDGHVAIHEVTDDSVATWLFEPGTFVPLAKSERRRRDAGAAQPLLGDSENLSTTRAYSVVSDHLGTPRELRDEVGRLAWKSQLDIFGVATTEGTRPEDCEWKWSGQYADDDTGLYYNRFRYYEPSTGRYISQDPVGLAGGTQAYGYVSDPLVWTDPLGLAGQCGTPSEQAAAWQGKGDYPGVDDWHDITLQKGTVLYGGVPGQTAFYTTEEGLEAAGGTRAGLGEALQVQPHPQFGYRPGVTAYVVTEDTPAASAITRANPQFGAGGAPQVYVPAYQTTLSPVHSIPLSKG
jgi:RHS repeat-associated protein